MEKQLPHVSILSLQEMALRKVAVNFWNFEPRTFPVKMPRFRNLCDLLDFWYETVLSKVSDKLSKLQLPETLAIEMMRVVKPIGIQIIRWQLFHEDYLFAPNQIPDVPGLQMTEFERLLAYLSMAEREFLDLPFLEKFHWTAVGTIDYRKTAEELVRCDMFDIVKRYKLASLYCLDHYIPELWKELPQESRRYFSIETPHITELFLHSCWPYILKGEEYKLDLMVEDSISFNQFAFEHSSSKGNKTAAKYFLQKLSPEEREASLVRAAKSSLDSINKGLEYSPTSSSLGNISDVVFYLLSEMTHEQQIQILRERPADVFGCFMYWPWQDAFLDFADAMWTWMQCEDLENRLRNYKNLLGKYQCSIRSPDYYFSNLLQNIFKSSPNDFRKYFVERDCSGCTFFSNVFNMNDTRTAIVILSNLDAGDRLRLVSSNLILLIFYCKISRGRGHLVETCLRESGFSEEDKVSLKEAFIAYFSMDSGLIDRVNPGFRRFFEFLDGTDARARIKRCAAGETSPEVKKLSFGKEENFTTK